MERKTVWLSIALGLLFAAPSAWANLTAKHGQALGVAAIRHGATKAGRTALHTLQTAAKAGDPVAEFWLGEVLHHQKHIHAAWKLMLASANAGNTMAQDNLGMAYFEGSGVKKNLRKAFYWFGKAARAGDPQAQVRLGYAYADGLGTPTNPAKAVFWWSKGAKAGNAWAEHFLGMSYTKGFGIAKNIAKGVYWERKAAKQGNADAENDMGVAFGKGLGVDKSNKRAVYWYLKAADQGVAVAQYNLGVSYANGEGVPKNHAKAAYWYKKAADQGYADAQNNLGNAYDNGQGVPKNHAKAAYWYTKAANQGEAMAETSLALSYCKGLGVPKSTTKAIALWKEAAAQGDKEAKHDLAVIARREHRSHEQASSPLKLFGMGLKGATRAELEPVLTKAGLTPHNGQVGAKWWFDRYYLHGQLTGATKLDVGYTSGQRFAIAEYTFPGSMDTGLVRRVINMVSTKYGQPSSLNGDYSLGNVTAVWDVGDGMEVKVYRGWPDATTYLDLIDINAHQTMKSEMANQNQQKQTQQAKQQGNAF